MLVYFLLATLIAQEGLFAYLGLRYRLDRTKLVQMMAILQDVDLFAMKEAADKEKEDLPAEQVSYTQILQTRAMKIHHLELREQAVRDLLDLVRLDQRKLAEERRRYEQIKTAFDQQLADVQERTISEGMDDNRAKLESIKAKQAKELLLAMLDPDSENYAINDVVTLLKGMPNTKSSKIITEFKTDKELEQIGEVLNLIREGTPIAGLAGETRKKLASPAPAGP